MFALERGTAHWYPAEPLPQYLYKTDFIATNSPRKTQPKKIRNDLPQFRVQSQFWVSTSFRQNATAVMVVTKKGALERDPFCAVRTRRTCTFKHIQFLLAKILVHRGRPLGPPKQNFCFLLREEPEKEQRLNVGLFCIQEQATRRALTFPFSRPLEVQYSNTGKRTRTGIRKWHWKQNRSRFLQYFGEMKKSFLWIMA